MSNFLFRLAGLLVTLALSASAFAQDIQADGAWVRATVPGQKSAPVSMFLSSKQVAKLTGASSPVATAVELRTMEHKGSMMKTLVIDAVPLPAGKRVDMTSIHGYHLVLTGLKKSFQTGETVPLTLTIETADRHSVKIEVQAEVRPPKEAARKGGADHSMH